MLPAIDSGLASHALAVMTLQAGHNSAVVLVGTSLLGMAAAVVGTFTFLRKRALIADALSHATLPGIVLAFLAGLALGLEQRSLAVLLAGAAATGGLGVLTVQLLARFTRITEDAAIGAVLSVFYGVGIVLLSYVQSLSTGGQAGLKTFILGQTAAMSQGEATVLAGLAFAAVAAVVLLLKEFRLVCFDAEFAGVQGWPVFRIDLLMAGLTVFVTVIGLQTVGLILIVALLILPPVAARFWTDSLPRMLVLGGVFGGLSGFVGTTVSAVLPDVPAGAVIVLVAGCLFAASITFAPARGLAAVALRQVRLRLRLAEAKALGRDPATVSPAMRAWLVGRGLAGPDGEPTPRGAAAARNLRLWEAWLETGPDSLPGRVSWGVDRIETVLAPDELALLRSRSGTRP